MEPTAESTPSTPVTFSSGSDAVTLPKLRPMAEYRVEVVTADAADSAFDGDVYLTLTVRGADLGGEEWVAWGGDSFKAGRRHGQRSKLSTREGMGSVSS